MSNSIRYLAVLLLLSLSCFADPVTELFVEKIIDDDISGAYQTAIADINNDGLFDIAVLGEGESGVYWYENPSWRKRPICINGLTRHIDFDFYDLDNDGELELALASDFNLGNTKSGGTISWLDRTNDINQPWESHHIHSEPTIHRVRWADLDGDGQPELIAAPIAGVGSSGPSFNQTPVRLLSFSIPPDPKTDKWKYEVIDDSLHLLHGLYIEKQTSADIAYTASLEGVMSFQRTYPNRKPVWTKIKHCNGATEQGTLSGSSEVVLGKMRNGNKFMATIDPWHGNMVAVYSPMITNATVAVQRRVIDDSLVVGHALACADFDKDGDDEIIAGYRGSGHTIYYYDFIASSNEWKRIEIDKAVAAQGFAVGDVNRDGFLDFVAAGGQTHNLKLFSGTGANREFLK